MTETIWKIAQIIAWLVMAVVWYFSDTSALRERVAVAETRIEQETRGYYTVQASLGERLSRIEKKVDCLLDRRMC